MVRGVPGEPAAVTLLSEGAAVDTLSLPDIGESRKLTARVLDGHGNEISSPSLEWSTSDTAVVTVDSAGRVTARGAGEAEITASSGAAKGSLTVRVTRAPATLAISVDTASLGEGDTLRLSVVVKDRNGKVIPDAAVTWTSADAWVATVDTAGLVEAVHEGEVKITAASGEASASAAISVMGKIAFVRYEGDFQQIFIMNSDGSGEEQVTHAAQHHDAPTWAPDGSRIAYAVITPTSERIDAISLAERVTTVLSDGDGFDSEPAWSPDGTRIVFLSYRNNKQIIRTMLADGSNQRTIGPAGLDTRYFSWSPDGTEILYSGPAGIYHRLYIMKADGSEASRQIGDAGPDDKWNDIRPSLSPDGSKLLFMSSRGGSRFLIYVMSLPEGEPKLLSDGTATDLSPSWSPDGSTILFTRSLSGGSKIHIMNADGTGVTQLTYGQHSYSRPAWRPRPKR
jgi:Tol biopolymer transport system component